MKNTLIYAEDKLDIVAISLGEKKIARKKTNIRVKPDVLAMVIILFPQ